MKYAGLYALLQLGIILFLLGIFLPKKNSSKSILRRVTNQSKTPLYLGKTHFLSRFLENLSCHTFFKKLDVKDDSQDYLKYQKQIIAAGGLGGLTPHGFYALKYITPFVLFIALIILSGIFNFSRNVLNPSDIQTVVNQINEQGSFLKVRIGQPTTKAPGMNIIFFSFISLLGFFLPNLILKILVNLRTREMTKELPVIEAFTVLMLNTEGITVIDILQTLKDTTYNFKPYFTNCINEYYINPQKAIQTMADRVNIESFQVVCNGLKQSVDKEKHKTAELTAQHLDQIQRLADLRRKGQIKKKPLAYIILLAAPLLSIMVIWLYPWFIKATKLLIQGF